jgi:DNA helicase-2/ATP-dependent DNA helicase PcrA
MPESVEVSALLEKLNPAQREAVTCTEGPLLIFAGAGSGKTRVLTHRVAYLIAARGVAPRSILAVTFTNKAAQEMRERILSLIGQSKTSLWIGTFHATCARILRESGEMIGLGRDFLVYDDGDQLTLIRECMAQLYLDDKRFAPRAILSQISRAKEKLITPENYAQHYRGFFEDICGRVYELYTEKLRSNRALDFDDLLAMTVRLFEQRPDALERYQTRFQYILVDEYQDVNFVQYRFLKLLAQKHRNLCVVGDDDQSIYMFRGADVSLMLQFERDYPEARVIKLEQNYRSTQTILDAAHEVVSRNPTRKEKRLWTENDSGRPLQRAELANEQEEAVYVLRKIQEEVLAGRRRFRDFAILYRTNAQSRIFEEVFVNFRTPYKIVGGVRFYERKEVKDLIAYLRVILNPLDSVSLKRIINTPARGIGAQTLKTLEDQAQQANRTLWDMVMEAHLIPNLSSRAKSQLSAFASLILELRNLREKETITRLMEATLEKTGYLRELEADNSIESQSRAENIRELLTVTTRFDLDEEIEDRSLPSFLEQVSLVSDLDSLDASADAVTMMTLHSAKGLEFPVVFLVGMEEGVFPHMRSLNSDRELEEERRLCYVGITRAREQLYLTSAYRRTLFGSGSNNAPSRFLREIPEHLFHRASVSSFIPEDERAASVRPRASTRWNETPAEAKVIARKPVSKGGFKVGDKVRHETFGIGVVLNVQEVNDDLQLSVAFPNSGVKKLLQSFAKLTKVNP